MSSVWLLFAELNKSKALPLFLLRRKANYLDMRGRNEAVFTVLWD